MDYKPRLSHAVFTAMFGCVLMVTGGLWFDGTTVTILVGFGILLTVYSFFIVGFLANRERIAFYEAVTDLADKLARLDVDQHQALGIAFPTLRIHWSGKPLLMFEDSGVRMEEFERFMNDSNARYVSPRRNWSSGRQQRTWQALMRWLETHQFIYPESAAGSHSWLWRGNSYNLLRERYIYSETNVSVVDLNAEEEFMAGAPGSVYSGPIVTESGQ